MTKEKKMYMFEKGYKCSNNESKKYFINVNFYGKNLDICHKSNFDGWDF
jgi:hypothetical protein